MMPSEPELLDHDEPLDGEPDAGDDTPPEEPVDPDDGGGDGGGDGGEPVRWVTVGAFWNSSGAHLARLRVEAEGIDCVLLDELLVSTDWLYANAAGGIKLQVPHADAARAHELLTQSRPRHDDGERVQAADEVDEVDEADEADEADGLAATSAASPQGVCPRCGGTDVYRAWFSRRLFFGLLLFGLPLPLPIPARRCRDCRNEWWRRHERWHGSGRAGFEVVAPQNEKPAAHPPA